MLFFLFTYYTNCMCYTGVFFIKGILAPKWGFSELKIPFLVLYLILSSTLILTWLFSSQNACIAVDFLKITVMELAADIVVSNTIMIKKIWNVTTLIIMDAKEITIILIRTTNVPYSVEAIIGNILAYILLGPGFRKLLSEIWKKFSTIPNYLWSHTERNDFWISKKKFEILETSIDRAFWTKERWWWKYCFWQYFDDWHLEKIAKLKKITNKKPSLNYVQSISKMDFIHFSLWNSVAPVIKSHRY